MMSKSIDVISEKPLSFLIKPEIITNRLSASSYNLEYVRLQEIKNSSELRFASIGKIADVSAMIGWKGLSTKDYVDEDGIYMLRTVDIKDGFIDTSNAVMARSQKVYEQPQILLGEGDIVFSKDGTLGEAAIVSDQGKRELCVASTLARIRIKENVSVDNHYVLICLRSKIISAQISFFISGIAQPHINQEYIRKLEIPIPTPEIQTYIGDKVRKAEQLREEAKRLKDEAGEALKELFFLKRDELLFNRNAGYPSIEYNSFPIINVVKPSQLQSRIDPKAYHPEYYETLKYLNSCKFNLIALRSMLQHYNSGISSAKYDNHGIPIVMTRNVTNNGINLDCKNVKPSLCNETFFLSKNDVLFTTYGGPSIGKVDIVNFTDQAVFDYTILRMRFSENVNPYFMVCLLRTKFIQNQIRYKIKGTTGITFVIPNEVLDIVVPIFDKGTQDIIGDKFKSSLDNIQMSKKLIQEAKQDVESLIEGSFDMSKIAVSAEKEA